MNIKNILVTRKLNNENTTATHENINPVESNVKPIDAVNPKDIFKARISEYLKSPKGDLSLIYQ